MTIFQRSAGEYKVGLIGYGAIGRPLAQAVVDGRAGRCRLVAVLRQHPQFDQVPFLITDDEDEFFRQEFDLVVEVAAQQAVRQYSERVLALPADFLLSSIGALTDDVLQASLLKCAQENNTRLLLAGGALPAVDWMSAAAACNGARVRITQEKPATSWKGTPAEDFLDLDMLSQAQCFFLGSARDAASKFPQSSNITAMLALCTVGLDACEVELVADPHSDNMRTMVEFTSETGDIQLAWRGVPCLANPRTSVDVAPAMIKAIRNLTSSMVSGV